MKKKDYFLSIFVSGLLLPLGCAATKGSSCPSHKVPLEVATWDFWPEAGRDQRTVVFVRRTMWICPQCSSPSSAPVYPAFENNGAVPSGE